jgi:hypothetical protein
VDLKINQKHLLTKELQELLKDTNFFENKKNNLEYYSFSKKKH